MARKKPLDFLGDLMRGSVCDDLSGGKVILKKAPQNCTQSLSTPSVTKFLVTPDNHIEFLRTFVISRDDVLEIQTKDGRYRKASKHLTDAALDRALAGKVTVGCYNSSLEGTCKFALIDVDGHAGKTTLPLHIVQQRALKCIMVLKEFGIPYSFAESSDGNYHIYIFFSPSAKTSEAFDFIRWITKNAGVPDIEVFPKQRSVPEGEYGNLIRLPFTIHKKKNQVYNFLNSSFHHIDEFLVETIDITDFTVFHHKMKTGCTALVDTLGGEVVHAKSSAANTLGGIPPCIQSILSQSLTGSGGHYMRISIVCAYRDAGLAFPALCRLFTGQEDYNQVETAKQVRSILKKPGGYSYSCNSLRSKCGKFVLPLCGECPRGRRFKYDDDR